MADRPLRDLSYRTPLEAASLKSIDRLASSGASGLLDPISPGVVPGSDVANLSLLGYDASRVYTGRGPLEAIGAGLQLQEGDLAFRCNFATVESDLTVLDERAGRILDGIGELEEGLQTLEFDSRHDVRFLFKRTSGFRGVLLLRGSGLSPNLSMQMPKIGWRADSVRAADNSTEAERTCNALREFIRRSHEFLEDHPVNRKRKAGRKPPANIVIPWGPGKRPNVQPLCETYKVKAACVAGVSLIKGICKLAGMTVVDVPGATGDIDTDTTAKGRAALRMLQDHDLVFIHVEGPDEASHDGDISGKISIIEKIDSMVGLLIEHINLEQTCITVLADHTTSTRLRRHTGDPVPIVIAGADMICDEVASYSEKTASGGALGRIGGRDLMPIVLDLIGKMEKLGE
jgi:2,3-bisphosphoglycerate-independent phosphoglycerate mutase